MSIRKTADILQVLAEEIQDLADLAHAVECSVGCLDSESLTRPELQALQHADALHQYIQGVALVMSAVSAHREIPPQFDLTEVLSELRLDDFRKRLITDHETSQVPSSNGNVQFF